MNEKTMKLLSGVAKCAGLEIESPDDASIRISGFQHGDTSVVFISTKQPDSDLIFNILQKIGQVATHPDNSPLPFPWYINRPYENESAGEVVYKTRRILQQKLNLEWRANLWALCAYRQIGCPHEFKDFLTRHPEKLKLMLLLLLGEFKTWLVRFIKFPIKLALGG